MNEPESQAAQLPADEPPHPARYDPGEQARHASHVVEPAAKQLGMDVNGGEWHYDNSKTLAEAHAPADQACMQHRLVTDARTLTAW